MPRSKVKRFKMDWLGMETELREVLGDEEMSHEDKLICLDEVLARYTGRGNALKPEPSDDERAARKGYYPKHFDWEGF